MGPGPSNPTSKFLSSLGLTHGLDVDPTASAESFADVVSRAVLAPDYPFPDEMFDAVVSDYVVEHVEDPSEHFGKCSVCFGPEACTYSALRTCSTTSHGGGSDPALVSRLVAGRLRGTRRLERT